MLQYFLNETVKRIRYNTQGKRYGEKIFHSYIDRLITSNVPISPEQQDNDEDVEYLPKMSWTFIDRQTVPSCTSFPLLSYSRRYDAPFLSLSLSFSPLESPSLFSCLLAQRYQHLPT